MKRFLPPMIALTLSAITLVACGKNAEGSDLSASMNTLKAKYSEQLQGKFKSSEGEIEFTGNQFRQRGWMGIRHATEYFENDFDLLCDFERKGTFKILEGEKREKLIVTVNNSLLHEAKAMFINGKEAKFSAEKLNSLCTEVLNKFKKIEADVISISNNHVHILKNESYRAYDNRGLRVFYAEESTDFSHFYIKGEELDITHYFGQTFSGVYGEEYESQLTIRLDDLTGELSYEQHSSSCSSSGLFKVYYSLLFGLEFRIEKDSPCIDRVMGVRMFDFYSGRGEYYFAFHSPLGMYRSFVPDTNNTKQ